MTGDGQDKFPVQSLLTAQTESLLHHVAIGKNEVRQKASRGERFCPMLMHKERFNDFLRQQSTTIREIIQSCQMFGRARTDRLVNNLGKLAHSYLSSTNRLPSGLIDEPFVDFPPARIAEEKVGVWIGTELQACTHLYPVDEFEVALIVIDPEDSTSSTADPSEGGRDERYYALGFEHCGTPEKQAAVFIQKLFFELGDLEVRVAELKGNQPRSPMQEARIAESSRSDRNYTGSVELGDRCDEWDLDPQNCRKDIVNAVTNLNFYTDALEANDVQHAMLLDQNLNTWVRSPQFEKDMAGIKYPERRSWAVNVECVNRALRDSGLFGAR